MFFIQWDGTLLDYRLKMHPNKTTYIPKNGLKNIQTMKQQLKLLGLSIDWDLEISTCDEDIIPTELFIDFTIMD